MSRPPHLDTTVANVARAYDYILGGADNFQIDRDFAESIVAIDPTIRESAHLNKAFGRKVTDFMARQGVKQFLDLGSGIPTSPPSIHDTARKVHPNAGVVYVDNDPVVIAHNRAWRAIEPGLAVIDESFHKPDAVLAHPDLQATIDVSQPIGVLILSVLQNTAEDEDVLRTIAGFRKYLAPGSFLAISHISDRTNSDVARIIAGSTRAYGYPEVRLRSAEQLTRFFDGFDLIDPGVVDYRDWPRPHEQRPDLNTHFVGGVGKVPS